MTEEDRAELVKQLCTTEAEVTVSQIANPELLSKIRVGYCVTAVNGESILTFEYEEAMDVLKRNASSELMPLHLDCRCRWLNVQCPQPGR